MESGTHATRGLARSILSNWGTFVFSAVVNFMLAPYVVHSLGESQYGVWVLLITMVGHLGLLDLGVRAALTRYIARFHAAADYPSASRVYTAGIRIFLIAGALAIGVSGVMSLLVGRVFQVPAEFVQTARIVAILGGVNIAVSLVSGVFGGIVTGLERFDLGNGLEILVAALRTAAIVVALRAGHGLIMLSLVQLAASLLRGGASLYLSKRLCPELKLTWGPWDAEYVRLILTYGLSATLLHAAGALMLWSDSMVLGALLPAGMITFFSIAGNLSEYARSVVSGISYTISPRVSALQAKGEGGGLQVAVLTSARLATIVMLPMAVTFLIRGPAFISLWMGPHFADLSGRVLQVLAITLWTIAGYQVVAAAVLGAGKHAGLIPLFFAEAACNFVLSIIWVRAYGVIGTAFGTLVPRLVMSVFIGPWYVRRKLGLPLRKFWVNAFIQPSVAIVPFAAASYAIERFWPATNLLMYFAQVTLVLPLAAVGTWFVCLSSEERSSLSGRLRLPLQRLFLRAQ